MRQIVCSASRAGPWLALILVSACGEGRAPTSILTPAMNRLEVRSDVVRPSRAAATIRWNAIARQLVSTPPFAYPRAPTATRVYALLSVAQYAAALRAKGKDGDERSNPDDASYRLSIPGAIAGASVGVLTYLFPASTSYLEDQLAAEGAAEPNAARARFTAGELAGRGVAREVIARATTDGSNAVVALDIPVGPGYWFGTPVTPQWPMVRPWLMSSGSALRPPGPPAFGSTEYLAALAEVKAASARAPDDPVRVEQLRLVKFWEDPAAAGHHSGHWNAIATDFIVDYRFGELRAARTLALVNMAIADAAIACMDAKYHYWLIRPYQADATILTPIGQPPHASYPSLHSCQTGAAAGVLKAVFPKATQSLAVMEQEMNVSRIYAGLHYRFDVDVGLDVGHQAAGLALRFGKHGDVFKLLK